MSGPGAITAGQLTGDPQIEICDPDVHVATLNEEGKLKLQAQISTNRGYVSAEKNFDESLGLGWVPVDSVHSPVKRVTYRVEAARVGRATDYERLILEIWTNGTVTPEEAVSLASTLLKEHLMIFIESEESVVEEVGPESEPRRRPVSKPFWPEPSTRWIYQCARPTASRTPTSTPCGILVRRSEREMLETKNFGRKSLEEVQEILADFGLRLGMDVPEDSAQARA